MQKAREKGIWCAGERRGMVNNRERKTEAGDRQMDKETEGREQKFSQLKLEWKLALGEEEVHGAVS